MALHVSSMAREIFGLAILLHNPPASCIFLSDTSNLTHKTPPPIPLPPGQPYLIARTGATALKFDIVVLCKYVSYYYPPKR